MYRLMETGIFSNRLTNESMANKIRLVVFAAVTDMIQWNLSISDILGPHVFACNNF